MANDEVDSSEATSTETTATDPTGAESEATSKETTAEASTDWQKIAKDNQAAFTKSQQELSELREMQANLKGQVEVLTSQGTAEPVKDYLDDYTEEQLMENPSLVKGLLRKTREDVANVIKLREEYHDQQVLELEKRLKSLSPEIVENRHAIAELKQDSDYQGFTDEQLAIIISKRPKPEAEIPSTGGTVGGRRVTTTNKEQDIKDSPLYKAIAANYQSYGEAV